MKRGILYLLLFCIGILLSSSCKEPGETISQVLEDYTTSDQIKIGEALANSILNNASKFSIIDEEQYPAAYQYTNTVLNTLLLTETVKRRDLLDWELFILNDDNKKSIFTAPGGKIFIYTGFLRFINSESEFFNVLAHEIYYADTDVAINKLADQVNDAGFVFGDIVLGNPVHNMEEITCAMANLRFSENEIKQADNFAIDILCNFQYDIYGLKDLLIEANSLLSPIEWTNTRPYSNARLDNIMERGSICGMSESTYTERYQEFLDHKLP